MPARRCPRTWSAWRGWSLRPRVESFEHKHAKNTNQKLRLPRKAKRARRSVPGRAKTRPKTTWPIASGQRGGRGARAAPSFRSRHRHRGPRSQRRGDGVCQQRATRRSRKPPKPTAYLKQATVCNFCPPFVRQFACLCLCVCLLVCLSVCQSVCLSASVCLCLSARLSVSLCVLPVAPRGPHSQALAEPDQVQLPGVHARHPSGGWVEQEKYGTGIDL